MRSPEILADSVSSLLGRPLRSLLTILGVVTGVAAVIVVVAAGEGSRRAVARQLELLGTNILVVLPGPSTGEGKKDSLTVDDAGAIEREADGVRTSPETLSNATVRRREVAASLPVVGATPPFVEIRNFKLESGRFFTPGEERGRARVCVLGSRAVERLFERGGALGEQVKINGASYRVIGTFVGKGDLGFFHRDDLVVIPLATARTRLLGIGHVHAIAAQFGPGLSRAEVSDRIVSILRRRHRLDPALPKTRLDFQVVSQREMIETLAAVDSTHAFLLVCLAAVALVTGGVGIMNIMLVSVTERTAEIGIRKAVGATGSDIFLHFLAESVILSAAGAAAGVAAGAVVARVLSNFGGWELVISAQAVLISVAMAVAVGLVFGIYPALRAAAMAPVDALRS